MTSTSTSSAVANTTYCRATPPALLLRGIVEFNTGRFFACHETLEELWRAQAGPERELYQGVLQIGVGCYHAQRGNRAGASGQLRKGIARLERLPAVCQTVAVRRLVADAEVYLAAIDGGALLALPPKVVLT